jgi:serine/threonine protein kinase
MTYCDDGDIHSFLKKRNGELLNEKLVLEMFVQLAFAVQYIHRRRVIHRDLKTSNAFLMSDGLIKLGDFGISRVLERTKELARTMVGTPYYLSPEILAEQGYSFASDIWSLGVCLYEMTTLRHPFDAGNLHSLALRIMKGDFNDPDESMYSLDTRNLIRSMLSQLPEDRPTINQILKLSFLQRPISVVLSRHRCIHFERVFEEEPLIGSPINPDSFGSSVKVIRTFQEILNNSLDSTVKYSDEEYSADFEDFDEDDEQHQISDPQGMFNYICSQIGNRKATELFEMIQNSVDSESIKSEALRIIGESDDLDKLLPLAEAAVFLQNAISTLGN